MYITEQPIGLIDGGDDGDDVEEGGEGVAHARLLLPCCAGGGIFGSAAAAVSRCLEEDRGTAPAPALPNCPASRPPPATSK